MERPSRLLIREGSQPHQFLLACEEDEFHYLRGLLLLISSDHQPDGRTIILEDMPPLVFQLYHDAEYVIRFYLAERDVLRIMRIWRRGDPDCPI